jgi:hypothetical protein
MYKIFGRRVVMVAFQSNFYLEMHQNNLKTPKIYQFEAKKKFKFF